MSTSQKLTTPPPLSGMAFVPMNIFGVKKVLERLRAVAELPRGASSLSPGALNQ